MVSVEIQTANERELTRTWEAFEEENRTADGRRFTQIIKEL
jgi:hypothetical protein